MKKLKCWKKIPQKRQLLWRNNKKHQAISVTDISPYLPKSENYQVIHLKGSTGHLLEYKKSKSQDLKFAKSYMKKHNVC